MSKRFGNSRLVILPRDPIWLYAYWEIAPEACEELRRKLGRDVEDAGRWVLRVYDVTGVAFDGTNAHRLFDIFIDRDAGDWYVNLAEVNRDWCVDLGVTTPSGRFTPVARSNTLPMPRQGVSPVTDEQWGVLKEEFERLLKLSGVEQTGKGSFDIAKLMRERWEEIVSMSLPSSRGAAPSSSWRGAPETAGPRQKDFRLSADTELVVYGSTGADATLTVQGQPVPLRPDGSFSLRFCLPDGVQEYPVEATSADGTQKERITFVVRRETR